MLQGFTTLKNEDLIKKYTWHTPVSSKDLHRMLLEAQISVLESLKGSSIGQLTGNGIECVIRESEVSKKILDLELELGKL